MHLWFFPAVFAGSLLVWIVLRFDRPARSFAGPRADDWERSWSFRPACVAVEERRLGGALWTLGVRGTGSGDWSGPRAWISRRVSRATGRSCDRRGSCRPSRAGMHWAVDEQGTAISYLIAGTALPAAPLLPLRSGAVLDCFTGVALGVYALHPLVYLGLQSCVGPRLNSVWVALPAVFLVAVGIAVLVQDPVGQSGCLIDRSSLAKRGSTARQAVAEFCCLFTCREVDSPTMATRCICPHCRTTFMVDRIEEKVGTKIRCGYCNGKILIQAPSKRGAAPLNERLANRRRRNRHRLRRHEPSSASGQEKEKAGLGDHRTRSGCHRRRRR